MATSVCTTLVGLVSKPRVVREAAFVVDVAISLALAVIPGKLGWVACVGFFMLRDVADAEHQSPGKSLYKLRIISTKSGNAVGWRTSVVRSIILLTPLLNFVDIAHFVRTGRRLTDEWLDIDVVQGEAEKSTDEKVEDNLNPPTTD